MTPATIAEPTPTPATRPAGSGRATDRAPAPPVNARAAARRRLLLEGPIVSTLLRLAAPNVVVNVVVIAVTASVDAHFVGRLGSTALAGLSLVFPLMMLMQQMANGSMGSAIASAVARAIGAGRREDASALVVHALVLAAGMAALFSSVLVLGGPAVYALMGGRGPTLDAAVAYSNVIFSGALVYWVLGALTSVLRGAGQPTMLAFLYLGAEAVHVMLVPLLVFGLGPFPALGIAGAGIATVLSLALSVIVLASYLVTGRAGVTLSLRSLRLEGRLFVEILRVGIPASLQPILNNLTLAILTGFVGSLGPTVLAGFGAAVRLEYLQVPLTFGFGAGLLALVGTNIGAGQWSRALRITWIGASLAASVTGAIGLLAVMQPGAWTALFSATPEVHHEAASYLCIVGLAYPFLGLGYALSSAFQAAGRPLWPLVANLSRTAVVVGGGAVVIHATDAGLAGLAVVAAAGLLVYGATVAIAFRSGAWRRQPDVRS
ncbi:MAG TPA: MATE family efflux transporter [Candidatus Acidoferrum sp.]|nr:MATE family efflux transporter [Candidatus Acidoferrum sp.]